MYKKKHVDLYWPKGDIYAHASWGREHCRREWSYEISKMPPLMGVGSIFIGPGSMVGTGKSIAIVKGKP